MSKLPSSKGLGLGMKDKTANSPALLPPVEIPGYEILGVIGVGGMGVVYKARQLNLDRIVALKVISEAYLGNRLAIQRFQREAMVAARLAHPNIVTIYQAGRVGDHHFIAMEYVNGTNLQRLVEEAGFLSVPKACEYMRQATMGLQHAHEKGLVHRDIKPPNLMVANNGQVLKILDMGLARMVSGDEASPGVMMTQRGVFMGTPDFVAPEQALDARNADIRADLYSLGCTFYYILTGQLPFPCETVLEKLDKHRWSMPTPIDQVREDVPEGLTEILDRMMAKKPSERFQTPAEIAKALVPFCPVDSMSSVVLPPLSVTMELPPINEDPSTADGIITGAEQFEHQPPRTPSLSIEPIILNEEPTWPEAMLDAPLGEIGCWRGHTGAVQAVSFLRDGRRVVSASRDGSLRVWDALSGEMLHCWQVADHPLTCMAIASGNNLVLTSDESNTVRLWNLNEGKQRLILPSLTTRISSIAISADGRSALTGSSDGIVRLWNLENGSRVRRFEGHRDEVHTVAFSRDGKRILSGGRDFTIRLWDAATGKQLKCVDDWLSGHRKAVITDAIFTKNGQRILSAGSDHVLCLWNVLTGRMMARFQGHKGWVYSVAFSPNEQRILSGSGDKSLRLWELGREHESVIFTGHTARVTSVAFSLDGLFAISGSYDQTLRLWRLPT